MVQDMLVIGGKGKTGRYLVSHLRTLGIPTRVGTRAPTSPGDIAFDWTKPETAKAAFAGVQAIYIVAPTHSADHESIVPPFLHEALAQGVQRLVLLSASSLEAGGPMMGKIHSWLAKHAPEWAVLRPTWFMQNFSEQQHLPTIRDEGAIYAATGTGRVGFIDALDIARVAAVALTAKTAWNRDVILTGPQALSYGEVADQLSLGMNQKVRFTNLTVEDLAARYERSGLATDYALMLAEMDLSIAQGSEDHVTESVLDITGKSPTLLKDFIEREKACWLPHKER